MAAFAQQHAEECTIALSDAGDRADAAGVSWAGEAIYATSARQYEEIAEEAVNVWYDEGKNYNYENSSCAPGKTCRQYTQVTFCSVWLLATKLAKLNVL